MSLTDKHLIILGPARFDDLLESATYTLAKELAKSNFVYYIDYPFTWKDCFKLRNTEQFKRRKAHFSPSDSGIIETDIPTLKIVITPPLASINFIPEGIVYRKLLQLNQQIIIKRVKKIISQFNIRDYIYINSFNFHNPDIADGLNPALTVYHCVDPLILPYDQKHGKISEKKLVQKSDLIICTSKQLFEEKKRYNKNTYFVPNAADITHSSKALNNDLPVYEAIAKLKQPIIGYFGNIERRIDFDLLKIVIEQNKEISFAFVGPISVAFIPDWFYHTANVHLIGRVPYEQMPQVIKGFDVAIIPFKKDEVSNTIFPLKLFEYLGAGKPVVATNFNMDLKDFTDDTVAYCPDAPSFSNALKDAALSQDTDMQKKRLAIAAKNTWVHRANQFAEILSAHL